MIEEETLFFFCSEGLHGSCEGEQSHDDAQIHWTCICGCHWKQPEISADSA